MMMQALLLGFAYILAPGPVTIETVRRSISEGRRSAAAVHGGVLVGQCIYALLLINGVSSMLLIPGIKGGMGLLGAGLLIYLGLTMVRDRRMIARQIDDARSGTAGVLRANPWRSAGVGLMLILASPYSLIFWFSLGDATFASSPAALSSFLVGIMLGCIITVLIAAQCGAPHMLRFANYAWGGCAFVLLALGAQLGYATLFAGGAL